MSQTFKNGVLSVECPLCLKPMIHEYAPAWKVYVLICHTDKVTIAAEDPMVGKWDKFQHEGGEVECPACNAYMRVFATSDGYVKCKCPKPKCGASVASGEAPVERRSILQKPRPS